MPRRTPPVFKVGDWVRLSEKGNRPDLWPTLIGNGPWRIKSMEYFSQHEVCPSPWAVWLDTPLWKLWWPRIYEEHVSLDKFMTAVDNAVNSEKEKPIGSPNKSTRRKGNGQGNRSGRKRAVQRAG